MKKYNFLWLEGIFDEQTLRDFPSMSPATQFWQSGFIKALQEAGNGIEVVGFPVERVWPFGKLCVKANEATFIGSIPGQVVGYLNVPYGKEWAQYIQMDRAINNGQFDFKADYVVTYSCIDKETYQSPATRLAKKIRKERGTPWICIVADGVAPIGADGYIYLTWSYYQAQKNLAASVHVDGGVPRVANEAAGKSYAGRAKVLMYMGALTEHGGASLLAKAFSQYNDNEAELWFCGRGENQELEKIVAQDSRITSFGFVDEEQLNQLAQQATAFVNPRLISFEPNKLNYPSKLLHYFSFGKPVLSTFTKGLSPEYDDLLIPISNESEQAVINAITNTFNLSDEEYERICEKVMSFRDTHTWQFQINKFINWLESDL